MKRFAFAALAALSLFAFSCTEIPEEEPIDDDPIDKPDDKPDPKPGEDSITITTQGEIVIPASGGSATVAFTASGDWTASVEGGGSSWLVAKGVTLATQDQFKFRKDHDWQVNYGGGPGTPNPYVVTLDSELTAGQGGSNLSVPSAGVYDLLLDPNAALYKVVSHVDGAYSDFNGASDWSVIGEIAATGDKWTADVPMYSSGAWLTVNPASGGKGTGSITVIASANNEAERTTTVTITCGTKSATFTVRQPEDKGFIADFKGEYKVSAAAQTIELKARANVELSAESQADWITVAETKALVEKTIVLSIAANTGGARTGTVTVSAPELGLTQTVTVAQAGAGEIYIPDEAFRSILMERYDTNGDGSLSKDECEAVSSISIHSASDLQAIKIKSLTGIGYFTNLTSLSLSGCSNLSGELDVSALTHLQDLRIYDAGKLDGVLDLTSNKELTDLAFWGYAKIGVEKIDLSECSHLLRLYLHNNAYNAYPCHMELALPKAEGCPVYIIDILGLDIKGELDLSGFYELDELHFSNCSELQVVALATGITPRVLDIEDKITVEYRGEDVFTEPQWTDPVFRDLLEAKYKYTIDVNFDGVFSPRELVKLDSYGLFADDFAAIGDKVLSSLEDLMHLPNITSLVISEGGNKINASIPECISRLAKLTRISLQDSGISGTIPESIGELSELAVLQIKNCPISGSIPESLAGLKNLATVEFVDCPNLRGQIPENLFFLDYFNIANCDFDDSYITVPSSDLLDHTYDSGHWGWCYYFYQQKSRERNMLSGGTYSDYPQIHYRSSADGTAAIHADGEVELYHAASKGPGLDIFITGDGFTASNNTVGGTLETYMNHIAEQIIQMEPYNKLIDYFNIWFVYAHSEREGTGINSSVGLKFASRIPNPGKNSHVNGNTSSAISFVCSATGRPQKNGTVAVIMNTGISGGTCYWPSISNGTPLDEIGLAVGYIPATWPFDMCFIHEVLGHGFAFLGDEYDDTETQTIEAPTPSSWTKYGWESNVDTATPVRWQTFIDDSRYSDENVGAYLCDRVSSTVYRPTEDSVMREGDFEADPWFNSPSREAIWQRVQVLTHPENNWSSWADYIANGYNREEFVEFDLAPAPDGKKARAPRALRRASLPAGAPVPPTPRHAPPIIVTE